MARQVRGSEPWGHQHGASARGRVSGAAPTLYASMPELGTISAQPRGDDAALPEAPAPEHVGITVIMPAYNEAPNLAQIVPRTAEVLASVREDFEILVVDDGSTDGTADIMAELGKHHEHLRLLRLRRNYGKSTALQAGFDRARGDVVVLMDADGQDQPEEIVKLLDALDGGLDLATGRRVQRNDRVVKRHTSRLYNRVTAAVTGIEGEDFNSGLKAMKREVMNPLVLYGELHRYIPVLAQWNGFKVGEIDVVHAPRLHGRSKFGRARFWRGFLDLLTVKFITTYTGRPFHLFGGLGLGFGLVGGALLAWMFVLKLMGHGIGDRPALMIGVLLTVVAVQLMTLGLLAELIVHFRRDRDPDVFIEGDR
jgi:glycosyltransferase involved in cell wall biosynthesis